MSSGELGGYVIGLQPNTTRIESHAAVPFLDLSLEWSHGIASRRERNTRRRRTNSHRGERTGRQRTKGNERDLTEYAQMEHTCSAWFVERTGQLRTETSITNARGCSHGAPSDQCKKVRPIRRPISSSVKNEKLLSRGFPRLHNHEIDSEHSWSIGEPLEKD